MRTFDETHAILSEAREIDGVVSSITEYGAFIDLGGIEGLLLIPDITWGRIRHPSSVVEVGQELRLAILRYDPEGGRVSLGLKQLTPDPWERAAARFPVGVKVEGVVVSLANYGVFVEVERHLEGLVHISALGTLAHPREAFEVGDRLVCVVVNVDEAGRKLTLELEDPPGD